jgi:uncharacterized protein YbdZ (MbtH family)
MSVNDTEHEDKTIYKVVMNHDEQYSIWPDYKKLPVGWKHVGQTGLKAECLSYIKEVWTDMRPLSLRKQMEEFARNPPARQPPSDQVAPRDEALVDLLSVGNHPVEVALRPERSARLFKEAIDRNYVHIKFTQTKGGTELGFSLDREGSKLNATDLENETGIAHLEGVLTLDYVKVKCIADIDLSTLQGEGHLVKLVIKEKSVA